MAEYALILGLIAIFVMVAVFFLGGKIKDLFNSTGSSVAERAERPRLVASRMTWRPVGHTRVWLAAVARYYAVNVPSRPGHLRLSDQWAVPIGERGASNDSPNLAASCCVPTEEGVGGETSRRKTRGRRSDGRVRADRPCLLLLFVGIISFGRVFFVWNEANHLANETARWAAVDQNPYAPVGPHASREPAAHAAAARVRQRLRGLRASPSRTEASRRLPPSATTSRSGSRSRSACDQPPIVRSLDASFTVRGTSTQRIENLETPTAATAYDTTNNDTYGNLSGTRDVPPVNRLLRRSAGACSSSPPSSSRSCSSCSSRSWSTRASGSRTSASCRTAPTLPRSRPESSTEGMGGVRRAPYQGWTMRPNKIDAAARRFAGDPAREPATTPRSRTTGLTARRRGSTSRSTRTRRREGRPDTSWNDHPRGTRPGPVPRPPGPASHDDRFSPKRHVLRGRRRPRARPADAHGHVRGRSAPRTRPRARRARDRRRREGIPPRRAPEQNIQQARSGTTRSAIPTTPSFLQGGIVTLQLSGRTSEPANYQTVPGTTLWARQAGNAPAACRPNATLTMPERDGLLQDRRTSPSPRRYDRGVDRGSSTSTRPRAPSSWHPLADCWSQV